MTDWGMEWFGDDILEATNSVVAKTSKSIAEIVMADAKKILERNSKRLVGKQKKIYGTSPGGLLAQFHIEKSKFKNGGYLVGCQWPEWIRPYHASFVELGTYKDEAQPFMRPAVKKNRRKANNMFQDDLDSWMKTG